MLRLSIKNVMAKPLYIQGPYDNGNRILGILNAKVGIGNYNFIVEKEAFHD